MKWATRSAVAQTPRPRQPHGCWALSKKITSRPYLVALACLSVPAVAMAQQEWPCRWGDLPCLLREGESKLQQQQPEEAYLYYEQAAFIAPEEPAVRAGLSATLLRLGAERAANDLLAIASDPAGYRNRLEYALGYSNNRNQLPNLAEVRLTLPGQPTTSTPLAQPLKPDAGPVYWLNYTYHYKEGASLQLGGNASLDNSLGLAWVRGDTLLDNEGRWQLRGEYFRRLEDGWQGLAALRYRAPLGAGVLGDAEIGLRQESVVSNYHFIESRLGLYRETPVGSLGLSLQRNTPQGDSPPGGGQWRTNLLWGQQWRKQNTRYTAAAMFRYTRDDDTYHPYLANGQARWQQSALLTLGAEHPLGDGWSLWGRLGIERQRSNIEFFTTRRSEGLLGVSYGW